MIQTPDLHAFPLRQTERLRYSDTDRQGHINNAVFVTLLESGRVTILYDGKQPLAAPGCAFVIARLQVDFRAELQWPGTVEVASVVTRIGRSSFEFSQALFQHDQCAASALSVIVQMNEATRKSQELDANARTLLAQWVTSGEGGQNPRGSA